MDQAQKHPRVGLADAELEGEMRALSENLGDLGKYPVDGFLEQGAVVGQQ
jgi:hypothetical protein